MGIHLNILPSDILQALSTKFAYDEHNSNSSLTYLSLPHPRTGIPSLFLPISNDGLESKSEKQSKILEVQSVSPTNARSWFMGGEVVSDGKLLILTPVDPTFLLISALETTQSLIGLPGIFRPADDTFEDCAEKFASFYFHNSEQNRSHYKQQFLQFTSLYCARQALNLICDVRTVTSDIVVYRYSSEKVLGYLRRKVARISVSQTYEKSRTLTRAFARDGLMEDGKENLLNLGRLKAGCDLISQYLSPSVYKALLASYDFIELNNYIKASNEEAMALTTVPVNSKAKPKGTVEDKKRKGIKSSQGVEKLKKANTKGMAELSSFFGKKSG